MEKRPEINEYNPFYSSYISLIPEGDLIEILNGQVMDTIGLVKGMTDEQAHFRYAPGKWSVKEVLGHVADTEGIMAYRLLSVARGETASLPGFDENSYVQHAAFDRLPLNELLENLAAVRRSTVLLIKGLEEDAWLRKGTANGSDISVLALACIIAGHELHHRNIIKDRYIR